MKKHKVQAQATQCSLVPFPDEVETDARSCRARSPGCTEMARYAEDVYYETAIKLTREAAQVSIHRKHQISSLSSDDRLHVVTEPNDAK